MSAIKQISRNAAWLAKLPLATRCHSLTTKKLTRTSPRQLRKQPGGDGRLCCVLPFYPEYAVQVLHVVHNFPVCRTRGTCALFPPVETIHIAARIHVVGPELGDIQSQNANAAQLDRDIALRF